MTLAGGLRRAHRKCSTGGSKNKRPPVPRPSGLRQCGQSGQDIDTTPADRNEDQAPYNLCAWRHQRSACAASHHRGADRRLARRCRARPRPTRTGPTGKRLARVRPPTRHRHPARQPSREPPNQEAQQESPKTSCAAGLSSPPPPPNLYFDLFQQVTGAGGFSREQHEDDRLKHCWAQVRVAEGKELQPAPHPIFIVENGLLYCVAQRRGEEKTLLVVPRSKTEAVIEIAHAHPMAGHLGAQNTVQRLRDRFHWPGLEAEVHRFCQACPTCQRTSPRTPPPAC
ncbi:uncharacterized protein LOC109079250 isoform X1 [Cyprinus carpio]|uniref:Gypsy retrotransposon integrase-like protein 1 n=1 Tax=Cyprinus carpio TaxID=7962 RepID=A0A9Q9V8E7_CYPCA|nr:uncharacterized protein LOC109079250 isoform X1 [Cyprinus carpio]XP_018949976.2 uncharacterized protein LOC109079250 isoform X1 [Cyprinus carpio]